MHAVVTETDPSLRRRKTGSPLPWMLVIAAVVGTLGAAGVLRAADERTDERAD